MTVLAAHPINPPTKSHITMFMECILQLAAANYPAGSGCVCTSAHERRVNGIRKLQKLGVTKMRP
jgi:hypothetical protein